MNCSISSASKFDYLDHHYSRPHRHLCFEINFYPNGCGHTVINDQKYQFSKNSFALIPPGVYHDETFTTSGTVICLRFDCTDPHFALEDFVGFYPADSALSFYAETICPSFDYFDCNIDVYNSSCGC